MNNREKLPIIIALKKALDAEEKAIRNECDSELKDFYEEDGIEKFALKVDKQKVGEFLLTFSKEGVEITDRGELEEFALDYGFASVKQNIKQGMMGSAIKFLENNLEPDVLSETLTEEIVLSKDWELGITVKGGECYYMDTDMLVPGVRATPKAVKNTMVRGCKPEDVLPLVRNLPGGVDALLLGDGNE